MTFSVTHFFPPIKRRGMTSVLEMRKVTVSFFMSVCPSVRQRGTTRLPDLLKFHI